MTHRITDSFQSGPMDDPRIAQQLAIYKTPATIRSMKNVYFYVGTEANLIRGHPLWLKSVSGVPIVPNDNPTIEKAGALTEGAFRGGVYYSPLGTEISFDIRSKVNELLDIRVPSDRYIYEITLVEATIESDTDYYSQLPDVQYYLDGNTIIDKPTYRFSYDYQIQEGSRSNASANANIVGHSEPVNQELKQYYVRAKKLIRPQTLYCRIKELSNGEPYNWVVTNTGSYTVDKSHQTVVRQGDFNSTRLTLQFGHLAYVNRKPESVDIANKVDATFGVAGKQISLNRLWNNGNNVSRKLTDENRFEEIKYFDYNSEVFNHIPANNEGDVNVPTFYQTGATTIFDNGVAVNVSQASNRPPYFVDPILPQPSRFSDPSSATYPIINGDEITQKDKLLQGRPLFFNQQVSKINFRFVVKIINLF